LIALSDIWEGDFVEFVQQRLHLSGDLSEFQMTLSIVEFLKI